MLHNIKTCIFDVNGVLINSNIANAQAMSKAFTDDKEDQQKISDLYLTLTGIDRGTKIRIIQDKVIKRPFNKDEFELRWQRFKTLSGKMMLQVPITDGCRNILNKLKKLGIQRVAMSNTPSEELNLCLKEHGLDLILDIVIGGGDWPKKESLANFIKQYNLDPNQCLFIGDGKGDLIAARYSNIQFIGIDPDTGEFDKEADFFGPYKSLYDWGSKYLDI